MSFINNNWWLVPLIITVFSGILCPAMGTVLITHKRLLQVNLICHCVLPGLALALALGIHPSIGGVISGLLGSVIVESLTNRKSENYEAVMNTILAGRLGVGAGKNYTLYDVGTHNTQFVRAGYQSEKKTKGFGLHF